MNRLRRENAIYVCIASGSVALLLWVIPAHSPPHPGYGAAASLVPSAAAGVMLFFSILALLRNGLAHFSGKRISREGSEYSEDSGSDGFSQVGRIRPWHLVRFMVPCVLFVPAVVWLGFIPAGVAFLLIIQYLCGRRELVPAVIVSVSAVSLVYVAMRYGFGVPMPGA